MYPPMFDRRVPPTAGHRSPKVDAFPGQDTGMADRAVVAAATGAGLTAKAGEAPLAASDTAG
jgi:hypothetical protein